MTVTPFSKTLALVLVVALPFIGFVLGIKYQRSLPQPPGNQNLSTQAKVFQVIARNPEGTVSGEVDYGKVIKKPLRYISLQFNGVVDKKSLTAKTLYVLQGIEEKVPAKLSFDNNDQTVILTFSASLPKEGRLTVVADGIRGENGQTAPRLVYNLDLQIP